MKSVFITPNQASADLLADEISTLNAHINAATFRLLEKIQRFDERGLYSYFNCKSTAQWLSWACGIGLGAGREKVRVANSLVKLPKIRQAFREGIVGYSKVRALTRVATEANEDAFLNIAHHATAAQTERIIRNHRRVIACQDDKAQLKRSLTWLWDTDGALVFKGRLSAEQGALFLKALEQVFKAHEHHKCHDAAYQEQISVACKHADALMLLTEQALGATPTATSSADRYQVSVHVSAKALTGELDLKVDPEDAPQLENGVSLPLITAERLTCDGSIVPILENAKGEPLSVGRKTRTVPAALRRALKRRDKGCCFPGCEQIHYVDAHHIRHWAHGGETKLDNLVSLCRYHHRQLHEGGFEIECRGSDFTFKDALGRPVPVTREDHRLGDVETLVENVSAEISLDAAGLTAECDWRPPDYRHIADILAQYAGTERP